MKHSRGVFPGALLAAGLWIVLQGCASSPPPQPTEQIVIKDYSGFESAIAAVAEAALPCVVHIDVSQIAARQVPATGPLDSDAPASVPLRALGSGILFSADGDILTNHHVVENADSITVNFFDGTTRPARVVGFDRVTDIAVVRVEGVGTARIARIGDSDSLRVGEWVVAIGSPRGLDWTVTAGIVSATHRAGFGAGPAGLEDYIQTDAAINPGNSGGPLFNLRGEVIGMNSLIISQGQGSEGLGFAIPSRLVQSIAATLIAKGRITRGDLGINVQDLDDAVRAAFDLPKDSRGVVITEAVPLGPAAGAALTAGDIVTAFQQEQITSSAQLNRLVAAAAPGSRVTLSILRKGAPLSVSLKVADQVDLAQQKAARPAYALLGIRVDSVSADLADHIGLRQPAGVLVVEVVPGSPADNAGIGNGDIIFQVNGKEVNDQAGFRQQVGNAIQSGRVDVLVRDGPSGRTGFMQIPLQ